MYRLLVPQGEVTECLYFGSSFTGSLDSDVILPFLPISRMSCRTALSVLPAIQPPWKNGNMNSQIRPALHPQWAWGTLNTSHHCLANGGHLGRVVFISPNSIFIHQMYPAGLTCICPVSSAHSGLLQMHGWTAGCERAAQVYWCLATFFQWNFSRSDILIWKTGLTGALCLLRMRRTNAIKMVNYRYRTGSV